MPDGLWERIEPLWERIEPLLPRGERRFRYPGRKPFDDRLALQGILFVLHTGIGWEHLPQELGFGYGMTAWRRLRSWQEAGVWERLHAVLLAELHAAGEIDWSRAIADSSHRGAAEDFTSVESLGGAFGGAGLGALAVSQFADGDHVQRAVCLSVAAEVAVIAVFPGRSRLCLTRGYLVGLVETLHLNQLPRAGRSRWARLSMLTCSPAVLTG